MLWWESLSTLGRIFACIAVPFSIVLLIQTILLIFGLGGGDADGGDSALDQDFSDGGDADIEMDGDADIEEGLSDSEGADFRLFSLRGIISFFVVTGWIGLMLEGNLPDVWVILLSVVSGSGALFLTAKIFQWSRKLQSSGNIHMKNAVGTDAQVYLTIPASMRGAGKVHVMVQERLVESDAVTAHDKPLPTGSSVTVVDVRADNTLIVEPKN